MKNLKDLNTNILMTVEELAKYLKIKPDTIYKKVRRGELPAIKLGKLLRFPQELVDQWVSDQAAKTLKARKMIARRVEKAVGEVNKRARAASKVIGEVPDLIDDVRRAPLNKKQSALTKGLKGMWKNLNRNTVAKPARSRKRKPAAAVVSQAHSPRKAEASQS